MRTALVIPSLGAPHLERCLDAVAALEPEPDLKVLVLSGGAVAPAQSESFDTRRYRDRLGFAAAVNTAISALPEDIEAALEPLRPRLEATWSATTNRAELPLAEHETPWEWR